MAKNKAKMNKFVTGVATAAMVSAAVVPVASAAGFNDLDGVGSDVKAEIDKAVELGFFIDAPKFNPSTHITRGQAALTLARYISGDLTVKEYAEQNDLENKVNAFDDIPVTYKSGAEFQKELYYASLVVKHAGAFTQNNLNPADNVTRSQMAKIITQTFGFEKADGYTSDLTDIGHLDQGTKDYIEVIASHNITNVTTFMPAGHVTRSQMASFLVRSNDVVEADVKIGVATVESINATELKVKLTTPTTDLEAADFRVLVDGQKVTPSSVISDETGAYYTLTHTSLDGKAGTVSVNGTSASFDYAPAHVASATAVNGTVTLVFNKDPKTVPAVTDFKVMQNINGTTKAINASSIQWDAATKTAKIAVPTIYATEADQNVSYTVGFQETVAATSSSFTVAKVTEVKVDSVKALNSKQIQVIYNQEMDKNSVEKIAIYQIASNPDGATPTYKAFTEADTVAKLQDDKKTVIITLGANEKATDILTSNGILDNKKAFGLKIEELKVKSTSGKVLEQDAELAFKLDDTAAPSVSKVAVAENGNLVITFNEQVKNAVGKVTVNGVGYNLAASGSGNAVVANAGGVSTATIAKADLIDATKAGLEQGKSYTIAVSGQEDVYGETATSVYSSNFTYSPVTTAPVLKSVTAEDEKSFILEFNKVVTDLDPAGPLTVQVNKGAKQLATKTTTSLGGGKYKVTLDTTDLDLDVLYDRAKNEKSVNLTVYIPAIIDGVGNVTAAGSTSVTLSKDVTKPAVEKAVSTGAQLDVTLTEGVVNPAGTAVTAAQLAAGSYVLAENGRQIPTLAAGFGPTADSFATGNLAIGDDSFIFDYAAGITGGMPAEGNYTLVIKKDTITDQSLNNGNKNDEIRIPFAVGADLQIKPNVLALKADNTSRAGEIDVTFASPVTYESVANHLNYKIDGLAIPSASTFVLSADGKKLTITLPEASFKETKDRVVTVSGARNLAGTIMEEYQTVAKVFENEEVNLQTAKVVGDDIILTFNENVDTSAMNAKLVPSDFIVKVNGTDVGTVAQAYNKTDDTATTKVNDNQVRLIAPANVNFATGTITVEVKEGAAAKDKAGNKATPKIVNVTR